MLTAALLAHTTGLGEIGLVVPVIVAIVGLLAVARRRAERGDLAPARAADEAGADAGGASGPPGGPTGDDASI